MFPFTKKDAFTMKTPHLFGAALLALAASGTGWAQSAPAPAVAASAAAAPAAAMPGINGYTIRRVAHLRPKRLSGCRDTSLLL